MTAAPLTAAAMIAVMALEILGRIWPTPAIDAAGRLAVVAMLVAALPRLGRREAYLLSLCALAAGLVLRLHADPAPVLAVALGQARFLVAFILLLGLLYEAAITSPSVAEFGPWLTRQPPGRRYVALNAGTGALAVMFNASIVSFLVPLVRAAKQRKDEGADDGLDAIRERRQICALQRGFAWSVIWSPTALAPLAILELIPGVDRGVWIVYGLGVFAMMLALGMAEDRWRFRHYLPRPGRIAPTYPARAALRLAMACVWLFCLTLAAMVVFGGTVVSGLMVACPVMLLGWIAVQFAPKGAPGRRQAAARLGHILAQDLPRATPVAVTLGAAGFMGSAGAALVPPDALALGDRLATVPEFLVLSAIPPLLAVLSLAGISPIMMSVFLGTLLAGSAQLPADPTLLALAISSGWALSMTFSPLATLVLLIDRNSGLGPVRLTWGWNLVFSGLAAAALVPAFALLSWLNG